MQRIQNIWAAGLAVLFASQACKLGGDEGIERSKFSEELVHAVCDTVPTCCRHAELQFDALSCRELMLRPYGGQVTAAAVHYDEGAAGECIEAARIFTERCEEVPANVCGAVFRGSVPPGGPCQTTFECDPGPGGHSVCSPEGICTVPARGIPGQPCSYTCRLGGTKADCKNVSGTMGAVQTACFEDEGLVCFLPPGEGAATCQPLNLDCRQRLDIDTACPPGGFCDQGTGACIAFSPVGGPCDTAPSGPKCGTDAFCHGGVCLQKFPIAARCDQPFQCASGRCAGGFCTMFSPAAAAMCRGSTS